jgi:hypothetical protein
MTIYEYDPKPINGEASGNVKERGLIRVFASPTGLLPEFSYATPTHHRSQKDFCNFLLHSTTLC